MKKLNKEDKVNMRNLGYDLISVKWEDEKIHFEVLVEGESETKEAVYSEKTVADILLNLDYISGWFVDGWDGSLCVALEEPTDRTAQDHRKTWQTLEEFIKEFTTSEEREVLNELI